jgi:hypothetical protein
MKHALVALLALPILLCVAGPAARGDTWGPYTYTVANGEATITGFDASYSGALSITNMLGGRPVTAIGDYAFEYCVLTSVAVPDSVATIGYGAFLLCEELASVTLGNGVVTIGAYAFDDCVSLASVNIPAGVATIGEGAFSYCGRLSSVTIPASVTYIGSRAFAACYTNLTSIAVDAGNLFYSSIDGVLFDEAATTLLQCPGGRAGHYTVPVGVETIAAGAFEYCTLLGSVTIPDSVVTIGDAAFSTCVGLASVQIPDSVSAIGAYAFSDCYGLASAAIGDGVTVIEKGTFNWCTNLVDAAIPSGVTVIGDSAFTATRLKSVAIPDGVTAVGRYVFAGCRDMTNIAFGAGAASIGYSAFSNCTSLPGVTIPDGIATIGVQAFSGCTGLASVVIGNGATNIGNNAFSGCNALARIMVGNSVADVGSGAFSQCGSLERVYFAGDAPAPTIPEWSVFFWSENATVYYLPGTDGWEPFYAERPTLCWNPVVGEVTPPSPSDPFCCTVAGTTNIPVRIEATTDLAAGDWTPLLTTNLPSASILFFEDPDTSAHPTRFYRVAAP